MATPMVNWTDEDIRQQAYFQWEADGCPNGRDLEHWELARMSRLSVNNAGAPFLSGQGLYEGGISAQPPVL